MLLKYTINLLIYSRFKYLFSGVKRINEFDDIIANNTTCVLFLFRLKAIFRKSRIQS